jgi:hypothetical protein
MKKTPKTPKSTHPSKSLEVSWSSRELDVWVEYGMVPKSLLDPSKSSELSVFISQHLEMLRKFFQSQNDNNFEIDLPPLQDVEQTYELRVVDKRTGEVVQVLQKVADFQLCDGISFRVKADELENWERETSEAKKLTKEQSENLKSILAKIGPDRALTRKEIATILEEIRKPRKKGSFRQSGHFVDQKLKYTVPKDGQPSLFDLVSEETKEKIIHSGLEVRTQGIRLTPPQDKLMNAILKLLQEKSERRDQFSERFYSGNAGTELVPYGGNNQSASAPVLRIFPSELYRAYMDSDEYSGADIKFIKTVLQDTQHQKFLVIYERKYHILNKGVKELLTDRIENFQSLFEIVSFFEGLTEQEKAQLDSGNQEVRERRGELVIRLNPLLRDQIDSKYVDYPEDINRRTVIAAGGHRHVTESVIALRDWMLRELSAKRETAEINEENLPYLLKLDSYLKEKRKSRVQSRVESAIQAVKNLGLVSSVEKVVGASGQPKYIFHINPQFE